MSKKGKQGKSGKSSGPVNTKAIPPKQVVIPKPAQNPVPVPQVSTAANGIGITEWRITLTIASPFLFPGISAGRFGVDRVGLRNRDNHLVIPQDQIKGVLRDAFFRLGGKDHEAKWFTGGSGDARKWEDDRFDPTRGHVHFSDLVCATGGLETAFAHRVKIDKDSGAAAEGHLMVIELPVPPEKTLDFTGKVLFVGDPTAAKETFVALQAALQVPLSIGALKSVGFGRIVKAICEPVDWKTRRVPLPAATEVLWRLSVDRPYLVNSQRVSDNAFVGHVDIPGAALKGALAQTVKALGHDITAAEIADYLSRMTIGPARPTGSRPAMARSIVYDKGPKRFVNMALPTATVADPLLSLDWKETEHSGAKEAGFLDQPDLDFDERVHTKIDRDTGGAEDEMLVSTIAVYPKAKGTKTGMIARLVLPADTVMPLPIKTALESCILPLGRTDAIVTTDGFTPDSRKITITPGRIVLRLLSDGLLADPYEDGGEAETPADATTAYRTFWASILPGSKLIDHFTSQTLIGGYQARRFAPTGAYRPWIMTEAGSVFVVNLAADDVPKLESILSHGLCRPTLGGVALTWRNCPFVAENGYGAVAPYAPDEKDQSTW